MGCLLKDVMRLNTHVAEFLRGRKRGIALAVLGLLDLRAVRTTGSVVRQEFRCGRGAAVTCIDTAKQSTRLGSACCALKTCSGPLALGCIDCLHAKDVWQTIDLTVVVC